MQNLNNLSKMSTSKAPNSTTLVNFVLDQGFNEEKKRLKDSVSRQRDMPSALSIVNGRG